MASKFQLQIPEPCHENWNQMTPVEQGRYCGACQQNVVDFTGMSDAQLLAFFKKPSNGSVCGRFHTDQLHREIAMPQKRLPWFRYFFNLFIPAFLLTQKAVAQGKPVLREGNKEKPEQCTVPVNTTQTVPADKQLLRARVVNTNGDVIPFASIVSADKLFSVIANDKGEFDLPLQKKGTTLELQISSVGCISRQLVFTYNGLQNGIQIFELEADRVVMEEVVIDNIRMGTPRTYIAGGVSYVKQQTIYTQVKDTVKSWFTPVPRVFPNPVGRGQNLSIKYTSAEQEENITLRMLTISGQLVKELKFSVKKGNNLFSLPLETKLSAGLYSLTLLNKAGKRVYNEKVVVQ